MRLVTFNLAGQGPNDIEAFNPRHVVSIRRVSENETIIYMADGNNATVMGRFGDVLALLEEAHG